VPTDSDVRHAQKSDVRALSATLGRAFYDDPPQTAQIFAGDRHGKRLSRRNPRNGAGGKPGGLGKIRCLQLELHWRHSYRYDPARDDPR